MIASKYGRSTNIAPSRIADHRREASDEEDDMVSGIDEFLELPERDGVPQVEFVPCRVDTEVETELLPGFQFLLCEFPRYDGFDGTGDFDVFPVQLGDYLVKVEVSGFAPFQTQAHVSSGSTTQVAAQLSKGTAKEMVLEVKAKRRLVQTTAASSSARPAPPTSCTPGSSRWPGWSRATPPGCAATACRRGRSGSCAGDAERAQASGS